jgi:hypothetical protein
MPGWTTASPANAARGASLVGVFLDSAKIAPTKGLVV